mgnify:CR=1 FL=1
MKITEEGKDPNYWTRYFKKDHERVRHNFKGSENIEIDDLMLHMNTKNEIPSCDIKGDGESYPHNSSCHSNPILLKIILIVAGLFLFTRLCGTLICFNNTFNCNMGI